MQNSNWEKCKLKSICKNICSGGTPKSTESSFYGGNIPWLRTQEVNFQNIYSTGINITNAGLEHSAAKWVPTNTVIVAMYGNSAGRSAITKIPLTTNQACCCFQIDERQADYRYVYNFLKLNYLQIKDMANGGAQQNLNSLILKNLDISLPPLDEQKRIAEILGSLDDKIELLQKQNKTLEDMAKALFKSWFVDFDVVRAKQKGLPKADIMREYHLTDDLYDLFPSSFADSPLGPIPSGWTSTELKYYCQICSGFAFKSSNFNKNGKYKLVTIRNVQDGFFVQAVKDNITDIPSKMPDYCYLQDGDILLSLTGNVGRICLVYGKNYLLNQRVAKLLPRNSGDYMFLYSLFRTPSVYKKMQELAVGSAQQNLSPILTGNILFPLINRRILDIFSEITLPMYRKILINNKQIQTLTELRDTLLPPLISGKIRV